MTRRLWTSLIGVVLIVLITLGYNIATDNTPILGLDLQGGVSVILAPTEPATEEELIVIRDQIRADVVVLFATFDLARVDNRRAKVY